MRHRLSRHGMAADRWLPIMGLVVGVAALLLVVLVVAPPWFVQHRSPEVARAQNEVRTTLLQGLGGVVLLLGAYFTYRQLANSREQLAHTREQLQIAQQGQITERFTRAIDQLGHAQLDVRVGGIYALERIARDSPADHGTIGEVLSAFVRGHAPWPPRLPGQAPATASIDELPELQVWAADVQAALTVLGRGGFASPAERWSDRLDLRLVDLRRANLHGAHLENANLIGAHLEKAALFDAHLERAFLVLTHLEGALLVRTHLEGALLASAHLDNALLVDTYPEGARADERTVWPDGFDRDAAGVISAGEDAIANPPPPT